MTQDTFYEPTGRRGGLHKVKVGAHLPWAPCRELTAPDCDGWTGRENKVERSRTCLHLLCRGGSQVLAGNLNLGLSPNSMTPLVV